MSLSHPNVSIVPVTSSRSPQKAAHPVRGVVVAFVLGLPMVVSGAVAAFSLLEVFVSGWIPSRWFSGSAADWWFGFGLEGSASAFLRFMLGAGIASACYSAITWGFNGRQQPPSR